MDVLRPAGGGPTVSDGSLGLPILQGDFIANDPLASNTLLQDAPSGEWTVTARLDTTQIDANGEQAGLVIWKSESPNTFSKIVAIQSGAGNHQFEHIVTQSGGVDPPIPQSITPAPGGQLPDQVLLRARYDGTIVIGEFSADDGETWTLIGQEGHAAPLDAPLRVGVVAFRGSNGGGTASFDWFRVHAGSEPGGPFECGGACLTRSDSFDGALNTQPLELPAPDDARRPARVRRGPRAATSRSRSGPARSTRPRQARSPSSASRSPTVTSPSRRRSTRPASTPTTAAHGRPVRPGRPRSLPDRQRLDRRLPDAQRRQRQHGHRHVLRGQAARPAGPARWATASVRPRGR